MPYLSYKNKEKVTDNGGQKLENYYSKLSAQDFAGNLNYLNFRLVKTWIKNNGKKYKDYKYNKPDEYHNSPKVRVKENKTKMEYTDVIEENIFKANGKLISEEQVLKIANKVPSRVKVDESVSGESTVPIGVPGVAHLTPVAWVESAVKTWASVPTANRWASVSYVNISPFVVNGSGAAHFIPLASALSAVKTSVLLPTPNLPVDDA